MVEYNDILNQVVRNGRLEYLDFCKVLAIFLVTVAHCAQQISGNHFPVLMISKDSFISINMAVFMIASGYVINFDKMRKMTTREYLISKAIRLLLPMISWYLILSLTMLRFPSFTFFWSIYWYLGAFFICLSTIKLLLNLTSNVWVICIASILVLTCIPSTFFERCCYMIPFLWVGFFLRFFINHIGKNSAIILILIYAIMYYFWDVQYSIYVCPFQIWNINQHAVFALIFRFAIGTIGGIFVIITSKILFEQYCFNWLRYIARFGSYTLVFYTMSFVLNSILARVLWHVNVYVNIPGVLDLLAIIVTMLMMIVMYYFQILVKKNRWIRLVLLGEV